ncbi:hypothetical protein [Aquamicrobium sp. LC103]|uniref:hypothetical protein n=1 Tax=Aquamicrobium sp. LC103 TaxID=1120658 RepID=UPI00109CAA2D|nr:hypothetical protein [Aquamicrobium sp. LC103]TKT81028.1 hypothetical protein XW59_003895 [Aquamicrobium sp. LC103]
MLAASVQIPKSVLCFMVSLPWDGMAVFSRQQHFVEQINILLICSFLWCAQPSLCVETWLAARQAKPARQPSCRTKKPSRQRAPSDSGTVIVEGMSISIGLSQKYRHELHSHDGTFGFDEDQYEHGAIKLAEKLFLISVLDQIPARVRIRSNTLKSFPLYYFFRPKRLICL